VWRSSISSSGSFQRLSRGGVLIDEGIRGRPPEVGGEGAHPLEHPRADGVSWRGQARARSLGDVLGQVAGALELGDDADDRQGVPELARHGACRRRRRSMSVLELQHQLVDGRLAGAHAGQRLLIVSEERLVGRRHQPPTPARRGERPSR
jgi:hypothetical protein